MRSKACHIQESLPPGSVAIGCIVELRLLTVAAPQVEVLGPSDSPCQSQRVAVLHNPAALGRLVTMQRLPVKREFPGLPFCLEGRGSLTCIIVLSISMQVGCDSREKRARTSDSGNQNELGNERAGRIATDQLHLELKSDRSELGAGECGDLRLDVFNPSSRPIHWSGDCVLEQQGPSPPLPDGIGGAVEIPPGTSASFITIRICSANRLPGTYWFRLISASKSENPIQSNWVTIEVLP